MPLALLLLGLLSGLLLAAAAAAAQAASELPVLARIGPWPALSHPIAFRGRLWLVNSVKGRNHNAADLYSLDPWRGALRPERQLFSQDAGAPSVAGGLLYWPYEDARWSLGWGQVAVTDGTDWRLLTLPAARSFHTHAIAALPGRLVAATSAWRAALQVSDDGGRRWRQVYDQPTPERRVSRIVRLAALGDALFGSLRMRDRRHVLRLAGETVEPAPGLPEGANNAGMARLGDRLFLLLDDARGWRLWRHDGAQGAPLGEHRADWRSPVLAAGAETLWVAESGDGTGGLWRSADGRDWKLYARLPGGRPNGIAELGGAVFVTGAGTDGQGLLWGEHPGDAKPEPSTARLPPRAAEALRFADWDQAGRRLDGLLDDLASYQGHGRALRDLVFELARADPPADFFASRLARALPAEELSLIGGATTPQAAALGRWVLLFGMALSGAGEVPPALLAEPWTTPANDAEKYFAAPPGAMAALSWNRSPTPEAIAALIARLGRAGDPAWLQGDALGALGAATGKRFGSDVAAWQAWWETEGSAWRACAAGRSLPFRAGAAEC